jgi:release factor glutamine methyltransferase
MSEQNKVWKIIDLTKWTTDYLQSKGFESPRLNVELLLSHVLKLKRIELYLNFERILKPEELAEFKSLLKRRLGNEPVQYIIGETEFFSLKFLVNKSVLIPRPETEILVEKVIDFCKKKYPEDKTINVLDIGTGSGNIAISLAKNLPLAKVVAIDISNEALETAHKNAEIHNVSEQIQFKKIDIITEKIPSEMGKKIDILVSNPPYIPLQEFQNLPDEIKKFEPEIALHDNSDGFSFYKKIVDLCELFFNSSGSIFFEAHYKGGETLKNILEQKGFRSVSLYKDYNEIDRVVVGEWKRE